MIVVLEGGGEGVEDVGMVRTVKMRAVARERKV
jgi:hypothetical protein